MKVDEFACPLAALGAQQVHDVDVGAGCRPPERAPPQNQGIGQVVEQAVGKDQVVGLPRQDRGGQEGLDEARAGVEPGLGGVAPRPGEHGRGTVDAVDLPSFMCAREAKRDVPRATAEIEGMARARKARQFFAEQRDKAAVGLLEIRARVGGDLLGAAHEFGFRNPLHAAPPRAEATPVGFGLPRALGPRRRACHSMPP